VCVCGRNIVIKLHSAQPGFCTSSLWNIFSEENKCEEQKEIYEKNCIFVFQTVFPDIGSTCGNPAIAHLGNELRDHRSEDGRVPKDPQVK